MVNLTQSPKEITVSQLAKTSTTASCMKMPFHYSKYRWQLGNWATWNGNILRDSTSGPFEALMTDSGNIN